MCGIDFEMTGQYAMTGDTFHCGSCFSLIGHLATLVKRGSDSHPLTVL